MDNVGWCNLGVMYLLIRWVGKVRDPQGATISGSHGHDISLPSLITASSARTSFPPYSFVASLYIDGRQNPERRKIVYLDQDQSDFPHPHGKISFESRRVQSGDGTMTEHIWVFKEANKMLSFMLPRC